MINRIRFTAIAALIVLLGMGTFMAVAQERGGGDRGGDRGGERGFGRFDPEQMREMMMSRLQESLEFSDDEWTVVGPMVSNVMDLQQNTRGGFGGPMMFGMMGGPGGPGGERRGGGAEANNERRRGMARGFGAENPELTALSEILQSEGSAADIQAKLKEYRDAKAKKELALKNAQSELKKVLTVRQEAMLVLMGYLE